MRRKMHGFTLTETLVTVALLGMFTGLTLSAVGPMHGRYRRRQAAELLAAAVARARVMARDSGRCHVLEVYQDENTPMGVGNGGDRLRVARRTTADCESAASAADLELVEWVRMPSLVTLRVESATTPVWRPNGRLHDTAGDAELRVRSAGEELAIVLVRHGPVCVSDVPAEACP